jgi:hypothetical protein
MGWCLSDFVCLIEIKKNKIYLKKIKYTMSKFKIYLLASLLIILCFSSCKMEKRIYSSGYYIEWNNGKRSVYNKEIEKHNHTTQNKIRKSETLVRSNTECYNNLISDINFDENIIESASDDPTILTDITPGILASIKKGNINKQEVVTLQSLNFTNSQYEFETTTKNSEKDLKTNKLGLISFISVLLLLIFFIAPITPLPSFFLAIPSLLLGAIALRQIKKNPEKYKGKSLAKIGVIVGYLGCSIGLLGSLLFALFGGVIWLLLGAVFLTNIIISTNILRKD